LWVPSSVYRPIQPGEKGTLSGGFDQLAAVRTGRPGLTAERERQLNGAPSLSRQKRGGTDERGRTTTSTGSGTSSTRSSGVSTSATTTGASTVSTEETTTAGSPADTSTLDTTTTTETATTATTATATTETTTTPTTTTIATP
jgi:hypothetical protein